MIYSEQIKKVENNIYYRFYEDLAGEFI